MRISQSSTFLSDLVRQVNKGTLVPAAFQRPYAWSQQDVMALIASITKRYPLGSFLVWTPSPAIDLVNVSRKRLGPVEGDIDVNRFSLLLDGQNRLASIAWMMQPPDTPRPADLTEQEKAAWPEDSALVADLLTKTVSFVPKSEAFIGMRMPSAAMFDNGLLNRTYREKGGGWLAQYGEAALNAGMDWMDSLTYAFREARVVVAELENATAEEAKDVFMHICRVGVPMSDKDLNIALNWVSDVSLKA